jgi:hypothetical protein
MPHFEEPLFAPDLKVRRWGASAAYGINAITAAGRQWVDEWLLKQPFVRGTSDDGAVLYWEYDHETVRASAEQHGLRASAGIGPDPSEGEPYWGPHC